MFGTGVVLIIVLLTKVTRGAWITLLVMAVLYLIMNAIRRYYTSVGEQLAIDDLHDWRVGPARVHAIVFGFAPAQAHHARYHLRR